MDFLNSLSGYELVSFAALLAIFISQDLSPDEIDTLGNCFSSLGSNLSTIALSDASKQIQSISK